MAEVLPGELVWGNVDDSKPLTCARGLIDFWPFQDDGDEYFRGGRYSVPHYPARSLGSCFGPLALDQTVRFCEKLQDRMKLGMVAVRIVPGDLAQRSNCAVLVGAYLILKRQWRASAVEICPALGQEADLSFPCSWSRRDHNPIQQPDNLLVRDCWAGLQLARDQGWLATGMLGDPILSALALSKYRRMAVAFDAAWLVPGRIMVGADPMSTIRDPNPDTFKYMFPDGASNDVGRVDSERSSQWSRSRSPSPSPARPARDWSSSNATADVEFDMKNCSDEYAASDNTAPLDLGMHEQKGKATAKDGVRPPLFTPPTKSETPSTMVNGDKGISFAELADDDGDDSCHTVCKPYQAITPRVQQAYQRVHMDFVGFCNNSNVKLIVRANTGYEAGLREHGGSYDANSFRHWGLAHADVQVPDVGGGVPSVASIRSLLAHVVEEDQTAAVLVHCKGGFGRSVLLACCLLVYEYDVPGRMVLGWARVVRPGSFCTPDQERFICRIGGRKDLRKLLALPGEPSKQCCTIA